MSTEPNKVNMLSNTATNLFGKQNNKINASGVKPTTSTMNSIKNSVMSAVNSTTATLQQDDTILYSVIKIVIVILLIIAIFYLIRYFFMKYQLSSTTEVVLLDKRKRGRTAFHSNKIIPFNSQYGNQFTYSIWFMISENNDFKPNTEKHFFHKGSIINSNILNGCPRVMVLFDKEIKLRVSVDTQKSIGTEHIFVNGIFVNKIHLLTITLNNDKVIVYVNGQPRNIKKLDSLPMINDGPFYCNLNGGFDGDIYNIKYFNKALNDTEITNMFYNEMPEITACMDKADLPPYNDVSLILAGDS